MKIKKLIKHVQRHPNDLQALKGFAKHSKKKLPRCHKCGWEVVEMEGWPTCTNDVCETNAPFPRHTLMYFSGSSFKGENYVKQHPERLSHCGMLLSFFDLKMRGVTWRRLEAMKESK